MTTPKLSPALEEALHDAAMTIYDASDCGGTLDQFKSLLRSLVLQAQRETARRCAEIARNETAEAEGTRAQRGEFEPVGSTFDTGYMNGASAVEAAIEREFALGSGDEGEGKG